MPRYPEDHFTSTVDGAAAWEAMYGPVEVDDRPTLAELADELDGGTFRLPTADVHIEIPPCPACGGTDPNPACEMCVLPF